MPLKRSNSVDRFIRNVLPSAVAGLNSAVMPQINIRNIVKNDLQMAGEKKHDSGFGSGVNIGLYGLGLGQITSGFFSELVFYKRKILLVGLLDRKIRFMVIIVRISNCSF